MYKRSLCLCCLSYRKCLVWSYPVFEKRLDAEGVLAIFMCSVSADAFDIDRFMPLAERIFTDGGTDGGGGGGGGNGHSVLRTQLPRPAPSLAASSPTAVGAVVAVATAMPTPMPMPTHVSQCISLT